MTDEEKPWPSRFGTLGEAVFGKDDPFNDSKESFRNIISDEMPPTRNPLNPKEIFTSKSKLRARYKEAGVEEVGTAYDNGYDPSYIQRDREAKMHQNISKTLRDRWNHGK